MGQHHMDCQAPASLPRSDGNGITAMREAFERHGTNEWVKHGVSLRIRPWAAPRTLFAPALEKSGTR